MKILLAFDGSPSAHAAVDEVLRRPWPEKTHVRLVTVVERPVPFPPPSGFDVYAPLVEGIRATLREEAYRGILAAIDRLKTRADLETSYELRDGSPKQALLDAISEWRPDLVVAGSHGVTGLARLFLGSVSHALVTHAPCSVEIVKTPRAA